MLRMTDIFAHHIYLKLLNTSNSILILYYLITSIYCYDLLSYVNPFISGDVFNQNNVKIRNDIYEIQRCKFQVPVYVVTAVAFEDYSVECVVYISRTSGAHRRLQVTQKFTALPATLHVSLTFGYKLH